DGRPRGHECRMRPDRPASCDPIAGELDRGGKQRRSTLDWGRKGHGSSDAKPRGLPATPVRLDLYHPALVPSGAAATARPRTAVKSPHSILEMSGCLTPGPRRSAAAGADIPPDTGPSRADLSKRSLQ